MLSNPKRSEKGRPSFQFEDSSTVQNQQMFCHEAVSPWRPPAAARSFPSSGVSRSPDRAQIRHKIVGFWSFNPFSLSRYALRKSIHSSNFFHQFRIMAAEDIQWKTRAPSIWGEHTVLILILLRISFGLVQQKLCWEAAGIVGLVVCAGALEIGVNGSNCLHGLKSRRGGSLGIALGASTWPTVLAAQLIRNSREVSVHLDQGPGRTIGFWTAIASAGNILSFIASLKQNHAAKLEETCKHRFAKLHGVIVISAMVFLVSCLRFGPVQSLIHGCGILQVISSRMIFRYLFDVFPGSGTPGEVSLVAIGLVLYVGDAIKCAVARAASLKMPHAIDGASNNVITSILQALVLGLLSMPALYHVFSYGIRSKWISKFWSRKRLPIYLYDASPFIVAIAFVAFVFMPWWLNLMVGLTDNPFLWIINFLLEDPLPRLALCTYWLCIIFLPLFYLQKIAKDERVPRIIVRKFYHIMAVVMFTPALMLQPDFLRLAFVVAFAAFVLIELIRIWQIQPIGKVVQEFMVLFADERDTDKLIISHFSLLLGCALPTWLDASSSSRSLAPFAGILSVGIGDTMASVVGYNFGKWKLSKTNKKTVEGTMMGIFSVFGSCLLLLFILSKEGIKGQFFSLALASVCAGLLEAYTTQLDNAFVPLVHYSLLCL